MSCSANASLNTGTHVSPVLLSLIRIAANAERGGRGRFAPVHSVLAAAGRPSARIFSPPSSPGDQSGVFARLLHVFLSVQGSGGLAFLSQGGVPHNEQNVVGQHVVVQLFYGLQ